MFTRDQLVWCQAAPKGAETALKRSRFSRRGVRRSAKDPGLRAKLIHKMALKSQDVEYV